MMNVEEKIEANAKSGWTHLKTLYLPAENKNWLITRKDTRIRLQCIETCSACATIDCGNLELEDAEYAIPLEVIIAAAQMLSNDGAEQPNLW